MSFGWSAGDIISALKLVHQVTTALQDSGGASSDFQDTLSFLGTLSQSLQHLNALQAVPLDLSLAGSLREQCDHIRNPLQAFLDDVQRFKPALGVNSRRKWVFAAPRKIQWALSMSKKVKRLQDRIAVPMAAVGLILGQQVVQTTLQMPIDIQNRISYMIDTAVDMRIPPAIEATNTIVGDCDKNASLESERDLGLLPENEATKAIAERCVDDFSAAYCNSAGRIIHNVQKTDQLTVNQVRKEACEGHTPSSTLHRKLDQVDASLGAIRNSLHDLSSVHRNTDSTKSRSEIETAIQNILGSIWVLLSSFHLLVRELITLLLPFMIVFYKSTIHHLLQYGDHFLFEDAIGRLKRLPCAQFQDWKILHQFLINSFQDSPGLSLVLRERYMVMNSYNNYPITQKAWRAVIQPNCKIAMAMVLDDVRTKAGKCVDSLCPGQVEDAKLGTNMICPVCGKHLSILPENKPDSREDYSEEDLEQELYAISLHASSKIGPERPKTSALMRNFYGLFSLQSELPSFKRVACLEESNPVLYLQSTNGSFEPKMVSVPYYPDFLRIGRQCNTRTIPTPTNLYFDAKVVSKQHAKIYSDTSGRIWIRDTKSTNGTFINRVRLAAENQGSKPHELRTYNRLKLAVDIFSGDHKSILHHRVSAIVQYAGYLSERFIKRDS